MECCGCTCSYDSCWLDLCGVSLSEYPVLIPMQMTGVMIFDTITVALMLVQFHHHRTYSYAILAMAYLFPVLLTIPFLMTFPGLASEVMGGPQSAVWLWQIWHVVFPALIGLSVLAKTEAPPEKTIRLSLTYSLWIVLSVLAFGLIAVLGADYLPALLTSGQSRTQTQLFRSISVFSALVDGVAALALWRQQDQKTELHYWLIVVLVAFMGDILTSLAADHRYTVGWYISRVQGLFASGVLLAFMGTETGKLYTNLKSSLSDAYIDRKRLWEDTKMVRVSEERYRLLVTQTEDCGLFMLDQQGRIVTWNLGAEVLTGYTERQVLGRSFGFLLGTEQRMELKTQDVLQNTSLDQRHELEELLLRKDGKPIDVKMVLTRVQDQKGEVLGFAVLMTKNLIESPLLARA